ncbi:phospho-acceptor domain-containing protein [Pseudomonas duriflava]|uniref:histidine kinase n=1 Tax=Pseudomonas duriflava TaxID=459528 RepID=A0A562Q6Z7_9PSED|nr:ATP-binding protein [Pseudomonas duriflava]TWI52488.1 phospho-acceptor domain-containing protein [Pseudomonas duriflava]
MSDSPISPMAVSVDTATAEKSIRDLMGLLALPALWSGRDGETVLRLMIEAVERIVPVRFCLAQAVLPERPDFCLVRVEGNYLPEQVLDPWRAAAETWSGQRVPDGRVSEAMTPLRHMRIIYLSLGYGSCGGKIWFGSCDPAFPQVTQLAFLRAAASLAATGVQAARANHEREQASRAKDEFLAMLGHELRNPLAPIVMAIELLKLRSKEALSREHVIIERQANHLSRLVDDLLDVTRITRGKIELKKEPVKLKDVLLRAIEDTSTLMQERQHQLATDFPEQDIWIQGDAIRLAQVFTNLLTNAAKYTDVGGYVTVSMHVADTYAEVTVRDNGTGISPHLLPLLFNMFEQGAATIDRAKGGLGIGLALVKSFVGLHGGTVTAHSDGIGCGSEFTVRLPLLNPATSLAPVSIQDHSETPGKAVRVLIVDDNLDALESTAAYLQQSGHSVETTSDPLKVLDLATIFKPDVVILDIGLPVVDGYTLAARLREAFPAGTLRLVALTGYGQAADMKKSRDAGFDVHLVKPVAFRALNEAITKPVA